MLKYIVASSSCAITCRAIQLLRSSELHSETEKRKRIMFDDIILKNLGNCVSKPTTTDAPDHVLYSDGVDPCSIQFPNVNDPIMHDSTAFLKTLSLINGLVRNLTCIKGSFYGNRRFLVDLKMEIVKSRAHVTLINFLLLSSMMLSSLRAR